MAENVQQTSDFKMMKGARSIFDQANSRNQERFKTTASVERASTAVTNQRKNSHALTIWGRCSPAILSN